MTGDMTHFGKYFEKFVSGVRICRPLKNLNTATGGGWLIIQEAVQFLDRTTKIVVNAVGIDVRGCRGLVPEQPLKVGLPNALLVVQVRRYEVPDGGVTIPGDQE